MENVKVLKTEEQIIPKTDIIPSTHALGLQDLYKAAFSQEPTTGFTDFTDKANLITPNLMQEPNDKFYGEDEKIGNEKPVVVYKNTNYDENYQLYTLKGLQYSVDFVKPEDTALDLNYDPTGKEGGDGSSSSLSRPFDTSFQNDANSVLDLDKGIQIHLVKTEDLGVSTGPDCNFETCEYTGDAQILHRYLCDTAMLKTEEVDVPPPVSAVSLNFVNKQNNNDDKFDSESIGVNPEILGVRFEDCDFNSSDSFASTESIIPKNVKCPKCPKKFMFKSDLMRHDKYKHSDKMEFFCKYCSKFFFTQLNLFVHEKSHKKKSISYKCDTCKKVFKKADNLAEHMMKKHSKKAPFSCIECDKTFVTQILLNSHFRKVHLTDLQKPFKCDICSKSFKKKQGLSCHAKVHLEDHLYVCQLCNKAFSKIRYLKNHQKSHVNDEKESFGCDTCGKDFKTSAALEEHSRKHSGEKPFTCNVCMKSFAYKAYLKVHIKKHSEVKPFACSYCQKTFVTTAALNKHEKSHTKDKPFHCINCNLNFSNQSQLTAHTKKQKCIPNKSQEVSTQTMEFVEGNIHNVTLQNVNMIVDQTLGIQQPIVLTSIGSFIDSNTVPVILTQNPSGPYSVSSIT